MEGGERITIGRNGLFRVSPMGGAGALRYAPTYHRVFGAAQSIIGYAPDQSLWPELRDGYRRIRIRMDQGARDTFDGANNNAAFAAFLASQQIGFEFELYEGFEHWAGQILGRGGDRIFAFQSNFFTNRRRIPGRNYAHVMRDMSQGQPDDSRSD